MAKALAVVLLAAALAPSSPAPSHPLSSSAPSQPAWKASARTPADLPAPGWQVVAHAEGDLDGDGRPDAAVVLGHANEDEPDSPRWLVIARRGPDKLLHPWAESAKAVLCKTCGGVFGDPLESVQIDHRVLVINHYGGSRDRWAYTDRFLWLKGQWRHTGTTSTNTDTLDPDFLERRDHNLLTGLVIHTKGRRSWQTHQPVRVTTLAGHDVEHDPGAGDP